MEFIPPTSHFIYIPAIAILGLVLGFIWGSKATREAFTLEARRQEERAERARRRAERNANKDVASGDATDQSPDAVSGAPSGKSPLGTPGDPTAKKP